VKTRAAAIRFLFFSFLISNFPPGGSMKNLWTIPVALMVCVSLAFAQISIQVEPQAQKPDSQKPAAPRCEMVGKVAVKTFPAATVAGVMEKAADYVPEGGYAQGEPGMSLAYEKMMAAGFAKLGAWMAAGGMPMGAPFALFYEDPEKTPAKDLTCKIAFPTMTGATAAAPVVIEQMPEYTAVQCTYKGPYEGSGEIWKTCDQWVKDNGYTCVGAPMEVYVKNQGDKVPPAEYVTEIRMPVKKAEAKPAQGGK
jgi:effector-binding domain-containing protein